MHKKNHSEKQNALRQGYTLTILCFFYVIFLFDAGARSASQRLRADVENLVTQSANDMWSAWSNSNTSLQQRVTETTDAHAKLQSHLAKTMQEIYDQEKHIMGLKKAIRDKEAPLKVRGGFRDK